MGGGGDGVHIWCLHGSRGKLMRFSKPDECLCYKKKDCLCSRTGSDSHVCVTWDEAMSPSHISLPHNIGMWTWVLWKIKICWIENHRMLKIPAPHTYREKGYSTWVYGIGDEMYMHKINIQKLFSLIMQRPQL